MKSKHFWLLCSDLELWMSIQEITDNVVGVVTINEALSLSGTQPAGFLLAVQSMALRPPAHLHWLSLWQESDSGFVRDDDLFAVKLAWKEIQDSTLDFWNVLSSLNFLSFFMQLQKENQ